MTMTTKDLSVFFGKSVDTIHRVAKKAGIFVETGKTKNYSRDEVKKISESLYKRVPRFIQYAIDQAYADIAGQPAINTELATTGKATNQIEQLGVMVANLCMAVSEQMKMMQAQQSQITAILSKPKEIEFVQDYFTIKGYANKIKLVLTFSEALSIGRAAGKLSRDKSVEIRKADDERFGEVNSYHIDVLREVFTV